MLPISDQNYLLHDQYRDSQKFDARVQLHARFGIEQQPWQRWVFDQLSVPAGAHILEIGCGPAHLWLENQDRLAADWTITVTDFSPGMLDQARANLQALSAQFQFEQADAQALPFDAASFDVVIANHMLYHVPNRPQALREILRVLRPGGRFYAATNGMPHMRELRGLVERFNPELAWEPVSQLAFNLESGGAEIALHFPELKLHQRPDGLRVTDAAALVAYITSTYSLSTLSAEQCAALERFIAGEIAAHGAIHVTKDSGLFEATKLK